MQTRRAQRSPQRAKNDEESETATKFDCLCLTTSKLSAVLRTTEEIFRVVQQTHPALRGSAATQ